MTFVPGKTLVHVSGEVFGPEETEALEEVARERRFTVGKRARMLERDLASWLGAPHARLVNSGSSANLLAVAALMSPLLPDRLVPGDEVITVAAGFPTTVAPIIRLGLVPVFVDVRDLDYNVNVAELEAAVSPRTRAVVLAHTLGVPFPMAAVETFCRKHKLFLVEDNCDALGSIYGVGTGTPHPTGTFGHLATLSFYPAHHMTTGEGGAVLCGDQFVKIVESLRDWGRACYCAPGCDNTCGRRFDQAHGSLPLGYDHKYVYSHLGFNLKMTEMQAAIGLAQLAKLNGFIAARKANWRFYRSALADLADRIDLPEAPPHTDPSWFGFLITVRPGLSRNDVVQKLEEKRIQTRPLFAGNILRQPAMERETYRVVGDLTVTDRAMSRAFWIGVYPGVTPEMREFVAEEIHNACR